MRAILRLLYSVVTMTATSVGIQAAAAQDGSYQNVTAAGTECMPKHSEAALDVTRHASHSEPPLPTETRRTLQLAFAGPDGMFVNWDVASPGTFDSEPLIVPGQYEFPQGTIYRFRLTNIPGHRDLEVYPTVEIAQLTPRTETIAMQKAVPIELTDEDFDHVQSGNFVTKVVYLPDPEFRKCPEAISYETMVGTNLVPNVDPIIEADRRGSILAIIRIGNKDFIRSSVPDAE